MGGLPTHPHPHPIPHPSTLPPKSSCVDTLLNGVGPSELSALGHLCSFTVPW